MGQCCWGPTVTAPDSQVSLSDAAPHDMSPEASPDAGDLDTDFPAAPGAGKAAEAPEGLHEAVRKLALESPDGEALEYVEHAILGSDRARILQAAFPACASAQWLVAISAKAPGAEAVRELTAAAQESVTAAGPAYELTLVSACCQIMYEDLTPSECVEYAFPEAPTEWALAQISRDALETYRDTKFEAWRTMLQKPSCEAQFRRMLQLGAVTRLFDPHVFPTPEKLKPSYQVTDDKTGKRIDLPHPVVGLRVWNAAGKRYEDMSPQLKGAPADAEKSGWWASTVEDLRKEHGAEYIDGLIRGSA